MVTLPSLADDTDDSISSNIQEIGGPVKKMPKSDANVNKNSSHLRPKGVYYGTSHARNGVVCQLSCQTTNGALFGCLQYPFPILTKYEASLCRQRIVTFIDKIAQ